MTILKSKKTLLILGLILAIVSSVIAGTLSVYTKTLGIAQGSTVSKEFLIDADETVYPAVKLAPTETAEWTFSVSNYRDDTVTETDMDMTVTLRVRAAEGKQAIDGLHVGIYDENGTLMGEEIVCAGEMDYEIPQAFRGNVASTLVYTLKAEWVNGEATDTVDTENAEAQNTTVFAVSVTGTQSNRDTILQSLKSALTNSGLHYAVFLAKGTAWTFGSSGSYDPSSWSGYLEKWIEKGAGDNVRLLEGDAGYGQNAIGFSNYIGGKLSIMNWKRWDNLKNSAAYEPYMPFAIMITNDSSFAYQQNNSYIRNNLAKLKGAMVIYKADSMANSETQVYYIKEDGSLSDLVLIADVLPA